MANRLESTFQIANKMTALSRSGHIESDKNENFPLPKKIIQV